MDNINSKQTADILLPPVKQSVNDMTPEEQTKHYKDLFTRSKKLILHYEDNLKNKETQIKSLKDKLKEYEAEDGKTCEFLFKFKYDNTIFYFFKSDLTYYFVNEKILEENFRKNLNTNETIKTLDYMNYTKELKVKDDTISQVINQYEDKMRRLKEENEVNERKISLLNERIKYKLKEMDEVRSNNEIEKRSYEQAIRETITVSAEIIIQMKNTLEVDLSDDSLQDDVYDKIKEMIHEINTESNSKWINELRSYTSETLLSFLDSIFKQISLEKNYSAQKLKWQTTLDQISLSHEEELKKSLKIIDTHKLHLGHLGQKISNLEQEKYNIAKQKDQTIDILSKELNKGVNINYLRNILISFLITKEESIQDGLLPVIFTALQFNDSEIKKVNEFRGKKLGLLSFFSK